MERVKFGCLLLCHKYTYIELFKSRLIFKQELRKKGLPRCYRFWKYLTMLATSTTDKKTLSPENLSQLCQEKQLRWNIFINYHQLCSSSFTNQK